MAIGGAGEGKGRERGVEERKGGKGRAGEEWVGGGGQRIGLQRQVCDGGRCIVR